MRTATVSNDNAFLEDRVIEGHQFDPSQFERLYLIGKGDVGRVYLCRTKVGGKLCAMKVLDQVRFAARGGDAIYVAHNSSSSFNE